MIQLNIYGQMDRPDQFRPVKITKQDCSSFSIHEYAFVGANGDEILVKHFCPKHAEPPTHHAPAQMFEPEYCDYVGQ